MQRKDLSQFLTAEMAARGWSIVDLAREADVTYEVVRRVVREESSPATETIDRILQAVGYRLRPVATKQDEQGQPPAPHLPQPEPEEVA